MFQSHTDKKVAYFLDVLWSGLERLHAEVKQCEEAELAKLQDRAKRSGAQYEWVIFSSFGSGPNDVLIANDFVWYASSAACFLHLFDFAFVLGESYRKEFKSMLKWRDKVSAHTAFADPITECKKDSSRVDTAASQDASIMMHPQWERDHYCVGGFILGGSTSSSHADWKWSLTGVHPAIEAFLKRHL